MCKVKAPLKLSDGFDVPGGICGINVENLKGTFSPYQACSAVNFENTFYDRAVNQLKNETNVKDSFNSASKFWFIPNSFSNFQLKIPFGQSKHSR